MKKKTIERGDVFLNVFGAIWKVTGEKDAEGLWPAKCIESSNPEKIGEEASWDFTDSGWTYIRTEWDDPLIEKIVEAMNIAHGMQSSRDLAICLTNLETALLWRQNDLLKKRHF